MERKKIDFRIKKLGLSRSQVSALTGISRSDLANFLNERGNLPAARVKNILDTLDTLETGCAELQKEYPGFSFNLKDMDFLRRMIAVFNDAQSLVAEAEKLEREAAQRSLDKALGQAAAVFNLPLN